MSSSMRSQQESRSQQDLRLNSNTYSTYTAPYSPASQYSPRLVSPRNNMNQSTEALVAHYSKRQVNIETKQPPVQEQ